MVSKIWWCWGIV